MSVDSRDETASVGSDISELEEELEDSAYLDGRDTTAKDPGSLRRSKTLPFLESSDTPSMALSRQKTIGFGSKQPWFGPPPVAEAKEGNGSGARPKEADDIAKHSTSGQGERGKDPSAAPLKDAPQDGGAAPSPEDIAAFIHELESEDRETWGEQLQGWLAVSCLLSPCRAGERVIGPAVESESVKDRDKGRFGVKGHGNQGNGQGIEALPSAPQLPPAAFRAVWKDAKFTSTCGAANRLRHRVSARIKRLHCP